MKGLGHDALTKIAALRNEATMEKQSEEGYLNYKNYETGTVAIWIENSQGDLEYWREVAQEIKDESAEGYEESDYWSPDEKVKFGLADRLKDSYEGELYT